MLSSQLYIETEDDAKLVLQAAIDGKYPITVEKTLNRQMDIRSGDVLVLEENDKMKRWRVLVSLELIPGRKEMEPLQGSKAFSFLSVQKILPSTHIQRISRPFRRIRTSVVKYR
jgi:hypothetical protein